MQHDKHTPSPLIMAATLGALGAPPGGRGGPAVLVLGLGPWLGPGGLVVGLAWLAPRGPFCNFVGSFIIIFIIIIQSVNHHRMCTPSLMTTMACRTLRDAVQPDGSASTGGRHLGC